MCFILATSHLTDAHIRELDYAWNTNRDGAGISTHDGDRLILMKPFMKWQDLERNLGRLIAHPCVVHLRQATHGAISGANCHPFWTLRKKALLAHNGIMPAPWSSSRQESDSKRFADMLMKYSLPDFIEGKPSLERAIGGYNKVVIMDQAGKIHYLNKQAGHTPPEDPTTWYSARPWNQIQAGNGWERYSGCGVYGSREYYGKHDTDDLNRYQEHQRRQAMLEGYETP